MPFGVLDAQVVVEVLPVVGVAFQLGLHLARLRLHEPLEQLRQGPAHVLAAQGALAEQRILLEAPGLHDEVVELAVLGRHLQRELVALRTEGHVLQGTVQLLDLPPPHVDQVLAQPEDDVLRELLDGLFLGRHDPLSVLGQPALAPQLALLGELGVRLPLDLGQQPEHVGVLGLELDQVEEEALHAAVDIAVLPLEYLADLGRGARVPLPAIALLVGIPALGIGPAGLAAREDGLELCRRGLLGKGGAGTLVAQVLQIARAGAEATVDQASLAVEPPGLGLGRLALPLELLPRSLSQLPQTDGLHEVTLWPSSEIQGPLSRREPEYGEEPGMRASLFEHLAIPPPCLLSPPYSTGHGHPRRRHHCVHRDLP